LFPKKRRRQPLKWIQNVLSEASNPKGYPKGRSGFTSTFIDKNADAFFQRIRDSIPSGWSLYIYSLRDMYNVSANRKTHYFVERPVI
jgi:hypothetical protein